MKNSILILLALAVVGSVNAQIFLKQDSITVQSSVEMSTELADLDNNGSIDYVIFSKSGGSFTAMLYTFDTQKIDTLSISGLASVDFFLADIDNNNRLDIISHFANETDTTIQVFYQLSEMVFGNPEIIDNEKFIRISACDLNRDGFKELVFSTTTGELKSKKRDTDKQWVDISEKLSLFDQGDWLLYDADNSGFQNLIMNGLENSTKVTSSYYQWNMSDGWIKSDSVLAEMAMSKIVNADFNNDGFFDLIVSGINKNEEHVIELYQKDSLIVLDNIELFNYHLFAADFNSDGLADLLVTGKDQNDGIQNYIYLNQGTDAFLKTELEIDQIVKLINVADLDYDGDLEFLVTLEDGNTILIYDNITEEVNIGPSIPQNHAVFATKEEIIIFWESSNDDHTKDISLTYDVFIGSTTTNSDFLAPNFDLINTRRLFSSRGNSGMSKSFILNTDLSAGVYSYGIQSIDNAFHYQISFPGSGIDDLDCVGRPIACGEFSLCEEDPITEILNACDNTDILIETEFETLYYSKKNGFLGSFTELNYSVLGRDTLYSIASNSIICSDKKLIVIEPIEPVELLEKDKINACEGDEIQLNIKYDVDSIQWSTSNGIVSTEMIYNFTAIENDIIFAIAYINACEIQDSLLLNVFSNTFEIKNAEYNIAMGQSVQLIVTKDVMDNYSWNPVESLDNPNAPFPFANPTTTTEYILTAVDSNGCVIEAKAIVNVEPSGWIPELFTPNNDSNNDILLVYGLSNIRDIKLEIYNRSGNKVYQSSDIIEITTKGWDGSLNGIMQPNGLYNWKVTGNYNTGQIIKLNSRTEGVIYLMK